MTFLIYTFEIIILFLIFEIAKLVYPEFASILAVLLTMACLYVLVTGKSIRRIKSRWKAGSVLVVSMIFGLGFTEIDMPRSPVANASESGRAAQWVSSERLNRRTCPSTNCGIVGRFFKGQILEILEERSGWVRVSQYYDASCRNGFSEYVDDGNKVCDKSNGISEGKMAEWVSAQFLSDVEPQRAAETAADNELLVAQSDDFGRHRKIFTKSAINLIKSGKCSESDFLENGGWVKSSTHRTSPIYFMYCGGSTISNRLYLNAKTGDVFR